MSGSSPSFAALARSPARPAPLAAKPSQGVYPALLTVLMGGSSRLNGLISHSPRSHGTGRGQTTIYDFYTLRDNLSDSCGSIITASASER